MGTGRVAGHGIAAGQGARPCFGNSATGLLLWLPPRGGGLLARLSALRVARPFCGRRAAGVARDLYPGALAGVAGLAAPTRYRGGVVRHGSVPEGTLAAPDSCRAFDDCFQLHVARHAGSLPDLSAKAETTFRQPDRVDRN